LGENGAFMIGPINPSPWRGANRKTARKAGAVSRAK